MKKTTILTILPIAYFIVAILFAAWYLPKMYNRLPQTSSTKETVSYAVHDTNAMLHKINEIREDAGKPPLVEDSRLDTSAKEKAKDLVTNNYWSHDRPDGEKFSKVIFKHIDANAVGENLAKCYDDPIQAWVDSPSHYKNIIGNWKYWGYGEFSSSDCKYIVNHFAR